MADADIPAATEKPDVTPVRRAADMDVPIEKLHPNPDQPRRDFGEEHLQELAESIRGRGVLQPLLVRADPTRAGDYQIVAGERRWRAAQLAGLHEVPVLIRNMSDTEAIEVAIVENIQRADLNAVEEAMSYRQLMDRFGHTQEKLAEALGKSRSHIANLLRLLSLPDEVLGYLREGRLSAGHARTLVTATNPIALAKEIIKKGLSVRQAEKLAKPKAPKLESARKNKSQRDADTKGLEDDLAANLGMHVTIEHEPGTEAGQITVTYNTLDELDELCRLLTAMESGESK